MCVLRIKVKISNVSSMSHSFEKFISFYSDFSPESLLRLPEIYAQNVVFKDPIHEVNGVEALNSYFTTSMKNLDYCQFEFVDHYAGNKSGYGEWIMHYQHPKINAGERLSLKGVTVVNMEDKIVFHRDYYDMGELLYEHVPLLGTVVKKLKHRIAS